MGEPSVSYSELREWDKTGCKSQHLFFFIPPPPAPVKLYGHYEEEFMRHVASGLFCIILHLVGMVLYSGILIFVMCTQILSNLSTMYTTVGVDNRREQ